MTNPGQHQTNEHADRLLKALRWRYATKTFERGHELPSPIMQGLIEAVRLAPSSVGLQPYKLIVIKDAGLRSELVAASWGQEKVAACSALFVFATLSLIDETTLDVHLDQLATERGIGREKLREVEIKSKAYVIAGMAPEMRTIWARWQTYLALGQLLAAAAMMEVDACPMEGFDRAAYDTTLGFASRNLSTTVLAAVGYRSNSDPFAAIPKFRKPIASLVEII